MRRSPLALFASALFFVTTAVADPPAKPEARSITSRIKREAVQSTAIASIGYSRRLRALEIEFRNGAIYRYLHVAPKVHRDLLSAPSKARFYDEHIRRKYRSLHVKRRSE